VLTSSAQTNGFYLPLFVFDNPKKDNFEGKRNLAALDVKYSNSSLSFTILQHNQNMSIPNEGTSTITQTAGFAAMYASRIRRRFISFENPARDSHAKKKGMEKRSKRQRQRERKVIGTVGRKSAKEWGIGHLDNSQAKYSYLRFPRKK
jgi:hypothetical protein